MDQIIILDGNVVGLISDSGAARWEFDDLEDTRELYRLLVSSVDIEDRIAKLSKKVYKKTDPSRSEICIIKH